MGTQPWDTSPVWTTVDLVKGAAPSVLDVARSQVAVLEPVDTNAAADAFIATQIVRAQARIIGGILPVVADGPEGVATTLADTPGDLTRYTTDQAIVEIYSVGNARQLPPNVERMQEGVSTWLAGLRMGHEFISTASPDADGSRSTPPRRTAPAGVAKSPLGRRAAALLHVPDQSDGGCW